CDSSLVHSYLHSFPTRRSSDLNVTPDRFSFTIDRRINPEEDLEEESARLRDALEGFEIETLQYEPAAATPAETPLGRTLSASIADRKSTRLNSSHVAISYAVFC